MCVLLFIFLINNYEMMTIPRFIFLTELLVHCQTTTSFPKPTNANQAVNIIPPRSVLCGDILVKTLTI